MNFETLDLNTMYSVSGILITTLYIPQLINVVKAKNSLQDLSMVTWTLWTICLAISTVYALKIAQDQKITLVYLGGTIFCGLISGVTGYKRLKYSKKSLKLKDRVPLLL